jgi:hypothetical protein
MTITLEIEELVPTSQRTQSAFVVLKNERGAQVAYRRFEVVGVPRDLADDQAVLAWIDEHRKPPKMWSAGQDVDEAAFLRTEERNLGAYYRRILADIDRTRRDGGTLDMALGAGLGAIGLSPRKKAAFDEYRRWLKLEDPQTAGEKAQLLLLMQNFALTGLVRER